MSIDDPAVVNSTYAIATERPERNSNIDLCDAGAVHVPPVWLSGQLGAGHFAVILIVLTTRKDFCFCLDDASTYLQILFFLLSLIPTKGAFD